MKADDALLAIAGPRNETGRGPLVDEEAIKGDPQVACEASTMPECDLVESFGRASEDVLVGSLGGVGLRKREQEKRCRQMHGVRE